MGVFPTKEDVQVKLILQSNSKPACVLGIPEVRCGMISVSQCSQLLFKDKMLTVHTRGKGIAGCFEDAGQIPHFLDI